MAPSSLHWGTNHGLRDLPLPISTRKTLPEYVMLKMAQSNLPPPWESEIFYTISHWTTLSHPFPHTLYQAIHMEHNPIVGL